MKKSEIKILTPNGMLGYGIPEADFWRGIDRGVDAIVVDSGSTDPGPYLLGQGSLLVAREAYVRDVTLMLRACVERGVPVYMGSAGGSGTNKQVDEMADIVAEIVAVQGWRKLKVAKIYSDIDRDLICERLAAGRTGLRLVGRADSTGRQRGGECGGANGRRALPEGAAGAARH
jgi:hypothetical protein